MSDVIVYRIHNGPQDRNSKSNTTLVNKIRPKHFLVNTDGFEEISLKITAKTNDYGQGGGQEEYNKQA